MPKTPDHIRWEPREDITTYELALTLKVIIEALSQRGDPIRVFMESSSEVKRHFKQFFIYEDEP